MPILVEQMLLTLGPEWSWHVGDARGTPMAVTMEQVIAALLPDEPDYIGASSLGNDALPFLEELLKGSDSMLASKAAYLAGNIGGPHSGPILMRAAMSVDPLVRAAVAGAVAHLPIDLSAPVIAHLLNDGHVDIRRLAIQSIQSGIAPELRSVLERTSIADPDPSVRNLARAALQKVRRN